MPHPRNGKSSTSVVTAAPAKPASKESRVPVLPPVPGAIKDGNAIVQTVQKTDFGNSTQSSPPRVLGTQRTSSRPSAPFAPAPIPPRAPFAPAPLSSIPPAQHWQQAPLSTPSASRPTSATPTPGLAQKEAASTVKAGTVAKGVKQFGAFRVGAIGSSRLLQPNDFHYSDENTGYKESFRGTKYKAKGVDSATVDDTPFDIKLVQPDSADLVGILFTKGSGRQGDFLHRRFPSGDSGRPKQTPDILSSDKGHFRAMSENYIEYLLEDTSPEGKAVSEKVTEIENVATHTNALEAAQALKDDIFDIQYVALFLLKKTIEHKGIKLSDTPKAAARIFLKTQLRLISELVKQYSSYAGQTGNGAADTPTVMAQAKSDPAVVRAHQESLDQHPELLYAKRVWVAQKKASGAEEMPFALLAPSSVPFDSKVLLPGTEARRKLDEEVFSNGQRLALVDLEKAILSQSSGDKLRGRAIKFNAGTGEGKSHLVKKIRDLYADKINVLMYDLNSSDEKLAKLKDLLPKKDGKPNFVFFDEVFFYSERFAKLMSDGAEAELSPEDVEKNKAAFISKLRNKGIIVALVGASETPDIVAIVAARNRRKMADSYAELIQLEDTLYAGDSTLTDEQKGALQSTIDEKTASIAEREAKITHVEDSVMARMNAKRTELGEGAIRSAKFVKVEEGAMGQYQSLDGKLADGDKNTLYVLPDVSTKEFSETDFATVCGNEANRDSFFVVTPFEIRDDGKFTFKIWYKTAEGAVKSETAAEGGLLEACKRLDAVSPSSTNTPRARVTLYDQRNYVGGDADGLSLDVGAVLLQFDPGSTKTQDSCVQAIGRSRDKDKSKTVVSVFSSVGNDDFVKQVKANTATQDKQRMISYLAQKKGGKLELAEKELDGAEEQKARLEKLKEKYGLGPEERATRAKAELDAKQKEIEAETARAIAAREVLEKEALAKILVLDQERIRRTEADATLQAALIRLEEESERLKGAQTTTSEQQTHLAQEATRLAAEIREKQASKARADEELERARREQQEKAAKTLREQGERVAQLRSQLAELQAATPARAAQDDSAQADLIRLRQEQGTLQEQLASTRAQLARQQQQSADALATQQRELEAERVRAEQELAETNAALAQQKILNDTELARLRDAQQANTQEAEKRRAELAAQHEAATRDLAAQKAAQEAALVAARAALSEAEANASDELARVNAEIAAAKDRGLAELQELQGRLRTAHQDQGAAVTAARARIDQENTDLTAQKDALEREIKIVIEEGSAEEAAGIVHLEELRANLAAALQRAQQQKGAAQNERAAAIAALEKARTRAQEDSEAAIAAIKQEIDDMPEIESGDEVVEANEDLARLRQLIQKTNTVAKSFSKLQQPFKTLKQLQKTITEINPQDSSREEEYDGLGVQQDTSLQESADTVAKLIAEYQAHKASLEEVAAFIRTKREQLTSSSKASGAEESDGEDASDSESNSEVAYKKHEEKLEEISKKIEGLLQEMQDGINKAQEDIKKDNVLEFDLEGDSLSEDDAQASAVQPTRNKTFRKRSSFTGSGTSADSDSEEEEGAERGRGARSRSASEDTATSDDEESLSSEAESPTTRAPSTPTPGTRPLTATTKRAFVALNSALEIVIPVIFVSEDTHEDALAKNEDTVYKRDANEDSRKAERESGKKNAAFKAFTRACTKLSNYLQNHEGEISSPDFRDKLIAEMWDSKSSDALTTADKSCLIAMSLAANGSSAEDIKSRLKKVSMKDSCSNSKELKTLVNESLNILGDPEKIGTERINKWIRDEKRSEVTSSEPPSPSPTRPRSPERDKVLESFNVAKLEALRSMVAAH